MLEITISLHATKCHHSIHFYSWISYPSLFFFKKDPAHLSRAAYNLFNYCPGNIGDRMIFSLKCATIQVVLFLQQTLLKCS